MAALRKSSTLKLVGINQLETRRQALYNRHVSCGLHDVSYHAHHHRSFSSVLASAAKYFSESAGGKKFLPTVLLLMASALNMPISQSTAEGVFYTLSERLQAHQQAIAKITEMIHVASLLHYDVLDDADKRHGLESLNLKDIIITFPLIEQLSVLAGVFLLLEACIALADIKNTEVHNYLALQFIHDCSKATPA